MKEKMMIERPVAIVDYRMGNLYSVRRACEAAGMMAIITSDRNEILSAPLVILPGVGAFGDAMATLHELDLVSVIRDVANSGTALVGICLGLQLLMTESEEFGQHGGLDLIPGTVRRLDGRTSGSGRLKVPEIGWNSVAPVRSWEGTPLQPVPPQTHMYFVHSYYVLPAADDFILSHTSYGATTFCSSVQKKNVFACQFHPERSGPTGLKMYEAMRELAGISPKREILDARV